MIIKLKPGDLRHRIHIQQQLDSTRDCMGGETSSWSDLLECWAAISTLSSKEVFQSTQSAQFASQVTHRITIRYPGEIGITAGMQVTFGPNQSHTAIIQATENVEMRGIVLYLMVQEIDGSQ